MNPDGILAAARSGSTEPARGNQPRCPWRFLAVAEGFEPSEAFTSHAFEACSLGRSDTLPASTLPEPDHPISARTSGSTSVPNNSMAVRQSDCGTLDRSIWKNSRSCPSAACMATIRSATCSGLPTR